MRHTIFSIVAAVVAVAWGVPGVRAAVLPVPASVRDLTTPREVVHILEDAKDGTTLGEQRSRVLVRGSRVQMDVITEFVDGVVWDERAIMDIRDGFRARSFRKTARRGDDVLGGEDVDFRSGTVRWRLDGPWQRKVFTFPPDTYTGPMVALVLASVSGEPHGAASFTMLTFRPDPEVYTLQADVMPPATFHPRRLGAAATKVRTRVDLGPVRNALLAPLIPTHYFWYTQGPSASFFAFEGQLGHDGHDLVMVPATAQIAGRTAATGGPALAELGPTRR
jgi:hypothetical protein